MSDDKYEYNRFGSHATRVGQAVHDILSKGDFPNITAEDIAEARQEKYQRDLREAADLGKKEFDSPFYVVYLFGKEHWSPLVGRGRFVRRQTEPTAEFLMRYFPYFTKDVWQVDAEKGSINYLWTLPSLENFKEILKHKPNYDESLTKWTATPTTAKEPYKEL